MSVRQHGNEQSLEGGVWEGGAGMRVSISCCLTTTEIVLNENTGVSQHDHSTTEGTSGSFVWIMDWDRSAFCFPFILSSSVQLRHHEGCISIINMALLPCSKIISQDAHHLQPKSRKIGRSSHDFR